MLDSPEFKKIVLREVAQSGYSVAQKVQRSLAEPEFVNVYGAKEYIPPAFVGLSYRPARLHRLQRWAVRKYISSANCKSANLRT